MDKYIIGTYRKEFIGYPGHSVIKCPGCGSNRTMARPALDRAFFDGGEGRLIPMTDSDYFWVCHKCGYVFEHYTGEAIEKELAEEEAK